MRIITMIALACVVAWVPDSAAGAGDAGVVAASDGEVVVRRDGAVRTVHAGFALQPGDSLVIRQNARCKGFSPVGEPFDREGPALVVFANAAEKNFRTRVSRWIAEQLAQWVGESRSRPLITRSGREWDVREAVPAPMIPAPNGCVRAGNPFFCWKRGGGVGSYTVTITSEGGGESSSTVQGNTFTPRDIEPGKSYAWKVAMKVGDADLSSPWREFRVMSEDEEQRLDESLADLSDLMAGIVLLSAGVHDEALYRFDAAVNEGTDREAALLWRSRALAAIGLHEEAYTDVLQALDDE